MKIAQHKTSANERHIKIITLGVKILVIGSAFEVYFLDETFQFLYQRQYSVGKLQWVWKKQGVGTRGAKFLKLWGGGHNKVKKK